MKLTIPQIIFLIILDILGTYFITGVLCFIFNNATKLLLTKYSLGFTAKALLEGYPKIYMSLGIAFFACSTILAIIPFLPKKKSLHGDAKFANSSDVAKMQLYNTEGIIIGKYNNKLLRFSGQQFVALGAPTRSGKGVGIVIPNLLDWKQSVVVLDIKQECFDYTSKYRAEKLGQKVYLFNPFDRRTHRYNPLTYIDMYGYDADGELTNFVNILYPAVGDNTTIFFNQLAQNLFIGLCYLYHDLTSTEKGQAFIREYDLKISWSLCGILELSEGFIIKNVFQNDDGEDEEQEIKGFDNCFEFLEQAGILSEKSRRRISSYLTIDSANTKSGVMSSFSAPLTQFRSDTLRLATETSDFDLRNLRKELMTIYIGITPDQLPNAQLILNIFWSQLFLLNTKELPQKNKELKYSCLLMMDEFTSIGQLQILQKSVSFIAGYNLRLLTIYQSISQLETQPPHGYGKEGAKTLLTNHACQIFYAPRDQGDAEDISKILGTTTVKNTSRSYNQGGSSSRSVSEASRALMLPQELRALTFDDELLTIDNGKPILCNKALYFTDPFFMNKFKEISPSLSKIKKIPNKKEFEAAILEGEMRVDIPTQSEEKSAQERAA
ncbi:type IV secretory system conjugative DNA transfer family protein [Sulfurospirillum sp. hDNRA2]|uniref:type IV secretory system conjugative DNA transfer family protein n=1 Tax=Sulfurospirillum sp. hDNRA2 TaxID=3237298 RepID=UPI0020B71D21|nr:type IV secretory system conjugative DNA transfer family protein [Sulfurospirillum sp. DNRA8]MCP3653232.1 type IV secretory system conjugative DNA transfer family protein [Sulfurospirillum sp. DNRA8]MCR1812083.1 type IV secretory system conjugative DNA transfer family protein [Sulfurospirillum sp. DNRA8]